MNNPLDIRSRQNNQLTKVTVTKFPKCDCCCNPAKYDAKTKGGPWGYFCTIHFNMFCNGLGTGIGQELVLRENL